MRKRRNNEAQEVNAGSMADIAFLLLVFFLVTTTINTDKGLPFQLPPKREKDEETEFKMKDKDVLVVLINSRNQLLVEEEELALSDLKETTKEFLNNRGRDPELSDSPQKAAVSYKADRGTDYNTYMGVLDKIKGAYNELRAEYIEKKIGKPFSVQDYLKYPSAYEQEALLDRRLLSKVEMYCDGLGVDFENKRIKEYLKFVPSKKTEAEQKAYKRARESGKTLMIEYVYDAEREYPLRISEAEPSKIGE